MSSNATVENLLRSSKSLHRTTQEMSMQAAVLEAALTRDEVDLFHQALAIQQRVRIGAVIALTVAAILIRSGSLVAIAIATLIAGAYAVTVLRIGARSAKAETVSKSAPVVLAVSDAIAATGLCALAALGGTTETILWILVVGSLSAPAMAYSFGARSGTVSLSMFAVGFMATGLVYAGLRIGAATGIMTVTTAALWGSGVWLLNRQLSSLRQRLDGLRIYAKFVEVGDVPTSDSLVTTGKDDFAMLARSFEAIHSRLYEQIGSDPLTGCANRRGLEKQLLTVCRLARRREGTVAVAAIDIDFFKKINDTHGHPEGDRVLRQLATIMMNTARDSDTVARLGGDEFVVILPDSDWRGARAFGDRLSERVRSATFGAPGSGMSVTISVGVAVAEGKLELEPEFLLSQADQALYEAKETGRNRVATPPGRRVSGTAS
jgi:diguanylate cyclase (GGDEF)-like protein